MGDSAFLSSVGRLPKRVDQPESRLKTMIRKEIDPQDVLRRVLPTQQDKDEYEGELVRYLHGRRVGYNRIAELFDRPRQEIRRLGGLAAPLWSRK